MTSNNPTLNATESDTGTRLEKDYLGECRVPAAAYYGINTERASQNFDISGIRLSQFPMFIVALAMVKKTAARVNAQLDILQKSKADSICSACDEIIAGKHHDAFVVDMFQGGAGTSTNMNMNEVIANRALEIMGLPLASYSEIHPNNHVNLSQSTNDVYPTAIRCSILLEYTKLTNAMEELCQAFRDKAKEFNDVVKLARTQLQDAVPMTLGQEFEAYAITVNEDIARLHHVVDLLREINLGGSAIGTSINVHPDYPSLVVEELSKVSGLTLVPAFDLIEATSDAGALVMYSGVLKRIAIKISKISSDLRLLSCGPRGGLNEINLPPVQAGSSIMPGKVNPVIPEVVNQVAFQIIGADTVVSLAAEHGQLQLNAMEPVIVYNILHSTRILTRAMMALNERCIVGITANVEQCRGVLENSIAFATALSQHIGYERASAVAMKVLESGQTMREVVTAECGLSEEEIEEIFSFENLVKTNKQK